MTVDTPNNVHHQLSPWQTYMSFPRLYQLQTRIESVARDEKGLFLLFTQTIFHPQGGGQPADLGYILCPNGKQVRVTDVQKAIPLLQKDANDFLVKHYVQEEIFKEGDTIELVVDKEKRQLHARLHSAGHLIAAVVEQMFPSSKATGGHHFPNQSKVNFKIQDGTVNKESVEKALSELNAEIEANKPIEILETERRERQIQIGDYPPVPCGGTHVNNTSLLENITIRKVELKKGDLTVKYSVSGE